MKMVKISLRGGWGEERQHVKISLYERGREGKPDHKVYYTMHTINS
jgi:hypothetical protein